MQVSDDLAPPRRRRLARTYSPPVGVRLAPSACRRRRLALGLTLYALAQHAKLDEQTVVRFEAGLARPRQVTVVALHNALRRLEQAEVRAAPIRRPAS